MRKFLGEVCAFAARLAAESRGVRAAIAGNVLCGVAAVALSLWAVALTRAAVEAACASDRRSLWIAGVMLCAAMLLRLVIARCGQRMEAWSITRFSARMRKRLFGRIMNHCGEVSQGLHSADIVNRVSTDVGNVSSAVCSTVPAAVVSLCSLAGSFVFLVMLAPAVAVIVTLLMPLAILAGKLAMKKTQRLTREIRQQESAIHRLMQDCVSHRLLISTLGYTPEAEAQFRRRQSRFFSLTMRRNDLSLLSGGAVALGFAAGYAVMFLYCAWGLADGTVSYATMTALLQLAAMVQRPAADLSGKVSPLVRASVSMERIDRIKSIYTDVAPARRPQRGTDCICLDNVGFGYGDKEDPVLDGFTECIPLGKVTSVHGPTGSGKTTLLKLLLGLEAPGRGEVRFPQALDPGAVVYVPQGNSLLSGSILSNLLMGKPGATAEEISAALRLAVAEFVYDLPGGLMTPCGEWGQGLSEGQAQRIAIARGLLRLMALKESGHAHALLLMDEPTSALDAATERKLCGRLLPYLRGETVVIITHKEIPGQYADKTIRLADRPSR